MARNYGDGTYGSGAYGGGTVDASITPATIARTVVILAPHIGQFVAGDDILYLTARHAPSIVLVARRGTPKVASHRPAITGKGSHGTIRKQATASQPIP